MKVLHVIAGLNKEGGGSTTSVVSLASAQKQLGHEVSVLTTNFGDPASQDHLVAPDFNLTIVDAVARWRYSSRLVEELRITIPNIDVVHVHGVWDFPPLAGIVVANLLGRPVALSMHGVLSPEALARSNWRKRITRIAFADRLIAKANVVIATGEHEVADLLVVHHRVMVLPHGVEYPQITGTKCIREIGESPVIGFLGRIHPFKGVDRLVSAAEQLRSRWPGLELLFAGPVVPEMEKWSDEICSTYEWTRFLSTISGSAKEAFLRDIDVLVLPSVFENFGLTVGEALARGTAVVATKRTAWAEIEERGVGALCDGSVDSLVIALKKVLSRRPIRKRAAVIGPDWMKESYSWSTVAAKSIGIYEAICVEHG